MAFVRQRNSGKGIIKVDIDVCDHRGDCVLLIKGLTLKKRASTRYDTLLSGLGGKRRPIHKALL